MESSVYSALCPRSNLAPWMTNEASQGIPLVAGTADRNAGAADIDPLISLGCCEDASERPGAGTSDRMIPELKKQL